MDDLKRTTSKIFIDNLIFHVRHEVLRYMSDHYLSLHEQAELLMKVSEIFGQVLEKNPTINIDEIYCDQLERKIKEKGLKETMREKEKQIYTRLQNHRIHEGVDGD